MQKKTQKDQEKEQTHIVYKVGCRGVVQLEGPNPWYNKGRPAKVGALR